MDPRRLLLDLYDTALRAVDGRRCVSRFLDDYLCTEHGGLSAEHGGFSIFAIGKAASAMALGAHDALGSGARDTLLITKDGHVDPAVRQLPGVTVMESAHPVPDERSLAAGEALLKRLLDPRRDGTPLFLISGGGSSLVEVLREGLTLQHLRDFNRRALASGWSIERINQGRTEMSRIKGGGLSRLLPQGQPVALFISDVPGDDWRVIASGLLGPFEAEGRDDHEPRVLRKIIANIDHAVDAVIEGAASRGLELARLPGRFEGDCVALADQFVAHLRSCAGDGLVWGGESTASLPAQPGRGGRNQHLALRAAQALRAGEAITILAAGTDGTDGPTDDAGAIVDAGTVARAELGGVDVELALRNYDSGFALEAAEDLLHTGPTGTNVGDVLIGIKQTARHVRDPALSRVL